MKTVKVIGALIFGVLLSACGALPSLPGHKAPFEQIGIDPAVPVKTFQHAGTAPLAVPAGSFTVAAVNVIVPHRLSISEANKYYPRADIVWRGELIGDRRAQIKSIIETAFIYGTKDFAGERPVVLDVVVTRFHSLSEKARYSIGGTHNVEFHLGVRDAETGVRVMPTRHIKTELEAFGSKDAIKADRRGQTQKVRVTGYLARIIGEELRKTPAELAPKPRRKKLQLQI